MKYTEHPEPAHQVVPRDPVRRHWIVIGLLMLGFGVSGYYLGRSLGGHNNHVINEELVRSQTLSQEQRQQIVVLKKQVAVAERSEQINRDAAEMVRKHIRRLEDENAELNQDLVFYRSIMTPEEEEGAVSVQKFELLSTKSPRHFQWKLVVMQSAKRHQFLKGELQVTIVGKQGGNSVRFSLHELSPQLDDASIRLGFRYFQSIPDDGIRGDIVLPEGFTPEYLQVSGRIISPKKRKIDRKFSWVISEL